MPYWRKLFIPKQFGQDAFIPQTAGCEHFLLMVARAETFPASAALVKLPFSDRSCEKSSGTARKFVNSLALGCESWCVNGNKGLINIYVFFFHHLSLHLTLGNLLHVPS